MRPRDFKKRPLRHREISNCNPCNTLQPLQRTATHCITLQHTATETMRCQKRPTSMSKETHVDVKRDPRRCQKRPTSMSTETHVDVNRDPRRCQQRPTSTQRDIKTDRWLGVEDLDEVVDLHCNTLHYTAPRYTTLHHTAPHCTTLQHIATETCGLASRS